MYDSGFDLIEFFELLRNVVVKSFVGLFDVLVIGGCGFVDVHLRMGADAVGAEPHLAFLYIVPCLPFLQ
jgi:hypothetical protein